MVHVNIWLGRNMTTMLLSQEIKATCTWKNVQVLTTWAEPAFTAV